MREVNIDVCKVTRRDGHACLDLILRIPLGYKCTNIQITPTFYSPSYKEGDSLTFPNYVSSITPGIDWAITDLYIDEWWRVDSSTFGIYHIRIDCELEDLTLAEEGFPEEISTEIYTSDVEFVYHCMVPTLLNLCGDCSTIPDSLLQQYLLLWGHTAALQAHDFKTAEYMYKKMLNCGNPCKVVTTPDCGCHGRH